MMYTYNSAYKLLSAALQPVYDSREASAIAHDVLEQVTGLTRLQRVTDKEGVLSELQAVELERMQAELLKGTPLQYIFGHAWFMGRQFMVNEHVLIPRPETEELVQWIVDDYKNTAPAVLDIGTGSGCIPVMIKLLLPDAHVSTADISTGAIEVAKENANTLNAGIRFIQADFLDKELWYDLPKADVIVSNPPYIPETEADTLHSNVRDFEPGLALFVPGNDALLFYRTLAEFGDSHLNEGGVVYCELHVDYAVQAQELFAAMGYGITELRKDMHGNLRMLKAKK